MGENSIGALVVDDYEPWRSLVARTLQRVPGVEVVSEASDAREAIGLAQQLRPELIVLDIGLPEISGIEAAREIRRLCPGSKILFLTENRAVDIAAEALSTGAAGYVIKSNMATDLLPAIKAVLEDQQFVSPSLRADAAVSRNNRSMAAAHHHEVAFYADDTSLVSGYARFIENALNAGSSVIVVVTNPHQSSLIPKLQANGVDVAGAIDDGSYVPFDANEVMNTLLVNDTPDPIRCAKVIGDLVTATNRPQKEHAHVMVCGEIAPTMLSLGNTEGAVELEHLWDEITRGYGVHTLCGYLSSAVPRNSSVFQSICAQHSAIHRMFNEAE